MSAATLSTLIFDQMLRAPRREALEKALVFEALLLSVNPTPTERDLHRLGAGDAGFAVKYPSSCSRISWLCTFSRSEGSSGWIPFGG